jgi:hypothetical protein
LIQPAFTPRQSVESYDYTIIYKKYSCIPFGSSFLIPY